MRCDAGKCLPIKIFFTSERFAETATIFFERFTSRNQAHPQNVYRAILPTLKMKPQTRQRKPALWKNPRHYNRDLWPTLWMYGYVYKPQAFIFTDCPRIFTARNLNQKRKRPHAPLYETKIKTDLKWETRPAVTVDVTTEPLTATTPRPCHRKHNRAIAHDRVSFELTARHLPSVLFYRPPAQKTAYFYF